MGRTIQITVDLQDVIEELEIEEMLRHFDKSDIVSEIGLEAIVEHFGVEEICSEIGEVKAMKYFLDGYGEGSMEEVIGNYVGYLSKAFLKHSPRDELVKKFTAAFLKALNLEPDNKRTEEIQSIKLALEELTKRVEALK